jgi:hypothetical protein
MLTYFRTSIRRELREDEPMLTVGYCDRNEPIAVNKTDTGANQL